MESLSLLIRYTSISYREALDMYYHEVRDLIKNVNSLLESEKRDLYNIVACAWVGKDPFKK